MNAIVQTIGELNKIKLMMMAGVAAVLLGFFIFLATKVSTPTLAPLYTNVSLEDSSEIIAELEKMGVQYRISAGGRQIMVPSQDVERTRVKLAGLGLPASGSAVGYEIFDQDEALGTSNFVLNVNKLRALEGELARTISAMRQVTSARVHLVIPKRELFTRERREPTASVALTVRGQTELSNREISAIKHMVASSVPGLLPTRITIIDNNGNLLARGVEDENDPEALASTAQEFRNGFESKLEKTIERLLERSVGYGHVKAEVSADIDFDRIVTNSEKFDPEGQVARSIQTIEELENENEKDQRDNVTAANNLPDADANNAGFVNNRNLQRTDETTNFEISKTVQNHVKETGTVNRLSVAVLVDGTYVQDEEGVETYQPRSEEELAQLETLVRSAVGFDANRGDSVEVINMQFAKPTENVSDTALDWLKRDLNSIIQTLVLAGVAILVILMIIRPLVKQAIVSKEQQDEDDEELQRLLASPDMSGDLTEMLDDEEDGMIKIDKIDGGIKSSLYRKVADLVDNHPEESLNVLRQWAFEIED